MLIPRLVTQEGERQWSEGGLVSTGILDEESHWLFHARGSWKKDRELLIFMPEVYGNSSPPCPNSTTPAPNGALHSFLHPSITHRQSNKRKEMSIGEVSWTLLEARRDPHNCKGTACQLQMITQHAFVWTHLHCRRTKVWQNILYMQSD